MTNKHEKSNIGGERLMEERKYTKKEILDLIDGISKKQRNPYTVDIYEGIKLTIELALSEDEIKVGDLVKIKINEFLIVEENHLGSFEAQAYNGELWTLHGRDIEKLRATGVDCPNQ